MDVKLIGQFVQHLEVTLQPGEEFFSERGSLIYMEDGIQMDVDFNGSGLGRILGAAISGESIFILRMRNTTGYPRKITLGSRHGILPIKLRGESMICHRGMYIASNNRVNVTTKISVSGMIGGMGLFLQKIQGDSTVFLDTNGTPIRIDLEPGRSIEVDENHIIALINIFENQMQSNWSLRNLVGGEGLSLLRVTGPGTVYLSPGKFSPYVPNIRS